MRAKDFSIILDDVAITDTQFSPLFTQVRYCAKFSKSSLKPDFEVFFSVDINKLNLVD